MKIYTRIIEKLLAVVVFTTIATALHGQAGIDVNANSVRAEKDSVVIDFDIVINEYALAADEQIVFTPVVSDRINNTVVLPGIVVNGRRRSNIRHRQLTLRGERDEAYRVLRASGRQVNERINYRIAVPRQAWMNDAYVYIQTDMCGCGGNSQGLPEMEVARLMPPEAPKFSFAFAPEVLFVVPEPEPEKKRVEIRNAYILFPAGNVAIETNLADNNTELDKLRAIFNELKNEIDAQITAVRIEAYASPEGSWQTNLRLSELRAVTLKNYIRSEYGIASAIIYAEGKGENWSDLYDMVAADPNIESKNEVMRIIREVPVWEGRETRLMNLAAGRPYRYMLATMFPKLRRTNQLIRIEYTAPPFSTERGKQLLKTNAYALSLDELYRIACTYDEGSDAFNELFVLSANLHPDNALAKLNAAAAHLVRRDSTEAEKILMQFADDARAWNNIGVLRMMQLRTDEAETYLNKALTKGYTEAETNLKILPELRKEILRYEQAKSEYEKYAVD